MIFHWQNNSGDNLALLPACERWHIIKEIKAETKIKKYKTMTKQQLEEKAQQLADMWDSIEAGELDGAQEVAGDEDIFGLLG